MWVRLRVVVCDAEGAPVEDEPSEIAFVFGYAAVLPAFENALEGTPQGARKSVTLKAEEAFGKRDPKAVLEVRRDEFPDDVAEGDVFDADEEDGPPGSTSPVLLRVLEVTPDSVILDRNHPLAGQKVRFDVEVLEVRPAEPEEISTAEAALAGDSAPEAPLIPAARLLRGGTRRYEKDP
ncbi:MAG TPA: peptidylprolyl isomerase [Polyangiaceae bacterium]|nr:peptidylprolyl isomerase [Polyangiaceae bacterium]